MESTLNSVVSNITPQSEGECISKGDMTKKRAESGNGSSESDGAVREGHLMNRRLFSTDGIE